MQKVSEHFEVPEFLGGVWIEPPRALCNSMILSAQEAACLRSVVIGAQWTQARQHEQGWIQDPLLQAL
eukprot:6270837-Pyramimonas_sp.AAC.1